MGKGMGDAFGLGSLAWGLGIAAIIIAVVMTVLGTLGSTDGLSTDAQTAINATTDSIATLGSTWLPIFLIGAVAVVLIGLFAGFNMNRGR